MNKEEFLRKLAGALNGQVSQQTVQENIRYYDQYISDEVRKGRTETEVIEEIGDPRLIAKTIEEAEESAQSQGTYRSYQQQTVYEDPSDYAGGSFERRTDRNIRFYDLNKWYWKLLGLLLVFLTLFLIVSIVGGIFALVIPLLGPLMLILAIYWLIKSLMQR